jgi:hypothetical protein
VAKGFAKFVQGAATASVKGNSRNPWLLAGLSHTNKGACDCAQPKEKRKVGRPIAYCGDINSPDLTPSERRRILRRIANRELARRVRARRLDLLDDMAQKVCPLRMPCACLGCFRPCGEAEIVRAGALVCSVRAAETASASCEGCSAQCRCTKGCKKRSIRIQSMLYIFILYLLRCA